MSQVDPSTMSRSQQMREVFKLTRAVEPTLPLLLAATFIGSGAVGFVLGWLLPGTGIYNPIFGVVFGLILGVLGTLLMFSRRAQRAAYARLEGQTGGAASALAMLRRGWNNTPAVGFDKNQNLVHRVVGPPGVVLVGEGSSPSRVRALLAAEKRKHQRVLPEVPITEIVVGNGPDETPIKRLNASLMKMKRQVKPYEITDILNRLKALDANRGTLPMPKGPMPTSTKGLRQNMRGR